MRLFAIGLMFAGCTDDTTSVSGDGTESATGLDDTGPTPIDSVSVTITADDTVSAGTADGSGTSGGEDSTTSGEDTTGSTGDSETGSTTGDADLPGQTRTQLVGVGQRMVGENHTMVFTLGQPTQTQGTHTSPNFRLQGGIVGANGNPP